MDLKHLAALTAATAALVTSVAALIHRPPEDDAKTAYDTLSKELEKVSADTVRNHDDLVALHGFLEGYTRKDVTLVDAGSPLAAGPQIPAPTAKLQASSAKPALPTSAPTSKPAFFALPPASPPPSTYKAPTFAAVKADRI